MKKLLQRLFGKKTIAQSIGKSPKVSDVLSNKQESDAREFYIRHKQRIDKLVQYTNSSFEPSQAEDKNNPMIWKTEYWKWFLNN